MQTPINLTKKKFIVITTKSQAKRQITHWGQISGIHTRQKGNFLKIPRTSIAK